MTDGRIDVNAINYSLFNATNNTKAWGEGFSKDKSFIESGAIVLTSLWGVGKLIGTSITVLFQSVIDGVVA